MIKVYISGNRADVTEREPLTSGTVGKVINFAFTEDWRLLIKYAVFEGSGRRIALTNIGESCIIPHEVLAKHGGALRVGVYGRTADGSAATPTVYAQLGIIQRGADPNADPSTKPTLPVWAQIQAQIGDIAALETEAKDSLVAAINEAAKSGGGGSGGKDGTGIESITYKGEDESGGNMYTVLLTDGTSYDITAPKGAKGDKGDAGGKGDAGKAATIQVGNVTTGAAGTPASVSNVGTDESAIFDFTIPRGDKGADGADGADGVTPHIGDNGNWYLGTTDTGKPSRGETGLQGPVGPAGPVGPQGPQGEKGEDAAADHTLGLTGATVGQIAKITAVDSDGKPTAWSPVDMPTGEGETWELLSDNAIDDDVSYIVTETPPCKRIRAYFEGHQVFSDGSQTSNSFTALNADFDVDGNQGLRAFYVQNIISRFNSDVVSVIDFDVSTPPFALGAITRVLPTGESSPSVYYPVAKEIAITDVSAITKITLYPQYKFVQGQGSIGRFASGGRLRIYGVKK